MESIPKKLKAHFDRGDRRPDPPSLQRRYKGKTTGAGVREYFFFVFQYNEEAKSKLTDHEIWLRICEEFPRDGILAIRKKQQTINYFRMMYNKGRLLRNQEKPPVFSFRYDDQNRRVSGRMGTRIITDEEAKAAVADWDKWWEAGRPERSDSDD